MTEAEHPGRRWLLGGLPEGLTPRASYPVYSGFLCLEETRSVWIAGCDRNSLLTFNADPGTSKGGVSIGIARKAFEQLWPATAGRRTEKIRHEYQEGKQDIRVDAYLGLLEGLLIAECTSPESAMNPAWEPPWWFGPEISDDHRFAEHGLALLDARCAASTLGQLLGPPLRALGAVPFHEVDGETRVVLVTNKSGSRWIFPKGTRDEGCTDVETALQEAREEAGAEGEITGPPQRLFYWQGTRCVEISYYPMRVATLRKHWEEMHLRERRLCTRPEALALLADAAFQHLLDGFWTSC